MTTPSIFTRQLDWKMEQHGAFFHITAMQNGQLLSPDYWLPLVFFKHEASFYGSLYKLNDTTARLSVASILDSLHPDFQHPYIACRGLDDSSKQLLQSLQQAVDYWRTPDVWQYIDEQGIWHFPSALTCASYLEMAIYDELERHELSVSELPQLVPLFKEGGWPLQSAQTADEATLAIRLSEPTDEEHHWLLEAVVNGKRNGTYWQPSLKKRALPIAQTLPAKWLEFAPALEERHKQALSLLSVLDDDASQHFLATPISDAQLRQFLQQDVPKLQAFGFHVVLPAWLKDLKKTKLRMNVSTATTSMKRTTSLDDVLNFNWQLSVDGNELSAEQFRRLVNEKREYIRIGTDWFQIDQAWLAQMTELMAKTTDEEWTVRDLLFRELPEEFMMLEEEDDDDRDDPLIQLSMQQSLQQYVEQLQRKEGLSSLPQPAALQADLRFYQQQGLEWLTFMRQEKFGACLADDMGLGKTIQLIAYLLQLFDEQPTASAALIICPTSVLGNWQREIARFAPSLRVYTHYGAQREKEHIEDTLQREKPHVVLSTYGTVTQDHDALAQYTFSNITLDEAQNIKNMHTQQSRAIRSLNGLHHIALTGTPVENRLSELWAIFDFIYKGYFGSFSTFTSKFIVPIERDDSERHKEMLRLKISPFLLRRTKRDPKLLLNLPEKQEQNEYCPLSSEQAVLYESYIQNMMSDLENLPPFERKGRILKMLAKLKQLCNHPALYLKEPLEDVTNLMSRSEKLKRIVTLAAQIVENGEQCLIFTQYIGMGELLQHCFKELYQLDIPFLTGATTKGQRDNLVEQFQAGAFPIFILSLKAGGTGLNLTAASHVLHADRWWNPAVENQATDRAYRIGQTQFVQVHKFVTTGTIEEKIDVMLTKKQALSEDIIQSSKWITELDDAELKTLLTYDA